MTDVNEIKRLNKKTAQQKNSSTKERLNKKTAQQKRRYMYHFDIRHQHNQERKLVLFCNALLKYPVLPSFED